MELEKWLNPNNEFGKGIMENKYLQDETFPEFINRVSNGNEELKKLLLLQQFLFGGRILSNRGLQHRGRKVTYSNCYVGNPPEDNIESIFQCAADIARTFSYGGGIGIDISKLAPRGSKVNNSAKETSGAVSFMKLYSIVTELIGQNGRRGALMISLDIDHPDLMEFIKKKTDLEAVTKANISVRMTSQFMSKVKKDTNHIMKFIRPETNEEIIKKERARDIFHTFAEVNWDYGEPGMLFWDQITKWNLLSNTKEFSYAGTNPCVSGNTVILTDKGYREIQECVSESVNVWNGYEFSEVKPRITGHNQPMKKITFNDGSIIRCTNYHKFILEGGNRVEAYDLSVGDYIEEYHYPLIETGDSIDKEIAIAQGINNKTYVPSIEYSVQSRLDWLCGFISVNGYANERNTYLTISHESQDVLKNVKYMLNTLGCFGGLLKKKEIGEKLKYFLYIDIYTLNNLIELGLHTNDTVDYLIEQNKDNEVSKPGKLQIETIRDIGIEKVVYCFTEPKNHSGIFNGVMTAQCGEEPLPAGGSCLLGSLNLSKFVSYDNNKPYFNMSEFEEAVKISVRALNEVLDEGMSLHPLTVQQESVRDWRQIGLGVFGIADMLIKLKTRYGSKESLKICDEIASVLINKSVEASAELAKELGCFPKCCKEEILSTRFFKENIKDKNIIELVKRYGLRNSQLLTIAPTGSISNLLGVSGGIEPIFAFSYDRKTESLHEKERHYKIYTPIVKEYMDEHGLTDESQLPDYFVSSSDITVKERIDMQSVWQKHIDASISSTVNLPESTTVEEVEELYMYAYDKKLKGITVFRDNCKRSPVLKSNTTTETEESKTKYSNQEFGVIKPVTRSVLGPRLEGATYLKQVACGKLYFTINHDDEGNLMEVFVHTGKSGGCSANAEALGRCMSTMLRSGLDVNSAIDTVKGVKCSACMQVKGSKIKKIDGISCSDTMAKVIAEEAELMKTRRGSSEQPKVKIEIEKVIEEKPLSADEKIDKRICPDCGAEIHPVSGCLACTICGWSKC